eukprot:CAMPEP_0119287160 /NCGR_PEP_ID=MMETSP1329-20130426/35110_1 /TAXON_ID=114041 /ORGANISM="Genus nov. species nov., Strain RCC1024" /LENGTH=94 /DNA_ID=CAMNT_0007287919 /DNA_START=12 /DNA_END=292 /DNA_ORIENTATION=+
MQLKEACQILGLPSHPLPDDEALRKAFRKEALKHHPDKNPGDEAGAAQRFQRVKEASEVIVRAKKGDAPGAADEGDEEDAFADFFANDDQADEV